MPTTSTLPDHVGAQRAAMLATLRSGAYLPLDQFRLLTASGADAVTFLHSMLTRDIQTMPASEARLAGLCSVKGRLLASLLVWRNEAAIQLMASADILAPLQKRLSLFVLRAKVKLDDTSDSTRLIGLTGITAAETLAPLFDALPDRPYAVAHGRLPGSDTCLIRLPDADGVARYLWTVPAAQWAAKEQILAAALPQHPATTWDWLDIRAGEPRITAATQEKFVPQMINFELLGGVDFKKGCYPGQEIVARSQYLGKVKRRMVLAHLPAGRLDSTAASSIMAGVDVFSHADPTQPCGMIVNAAAIPVADGAAVGIDCLVEIQLETLPQETAGIPPIASGIHAQSPDGPELTIDALLYQAT